jgi:hypothetical protein
VEWESLGEHLKNPKILDCWQKFLSVVYETRVEKFSIEQIPKVVDLEDIILGKRRLKKGQIIRM